MPSGDRKSPPLGLPPGHCDLSEGTGLDKWHCIISGCLWRVVRWNLLAWAGLEAYGRVRGLGAAAEQSPHPHPRWLSLWQGLGESHRSPCRWRPLSEAPSALPSHPSQQLWSQPVECPVCPAVDSSWVELCTETSQQRPFPGPQAALCGHCAGAMPAPGAFLGHSTGLHGWASWGRGLLTAEQ